MKVLLFDTQTGKTAWAEGGRFYWQTGNGSCDCNRLPYFDLDVKKEGICDGAHRILIVDFAGSESDPYKEESLIYLNEDYSPHLISKYVISERWKKYVNDSAN